MEPMATDWTVRRVIMGTLVVIAVAAGLAVLYWTGTILATLFLGIVLGTALMPVVDWLERHRFGRPVATSLVYVTVGLLLTGFVVLVMPFIVRQGGDFLEALPNYYAELRGTLLASRFTLVRAAAAALPLTILDMPEGAGATATMVPNALRQAASLGRGLFLTVAVLMLGFYWTLEGNRAIRAVLRLLPRERRGPTYAFAVDAEKRVGSYVRGVGLLCVIIGVLSFIAYKIIGIPNALVFAVVAGVLEAVPYVGPLLAAVPPLLVAFSISPMTALWVVIAAFAIQQAENYLLVPWVMKGSVGINGLVTVVAITAFGSLLGVVGVLLAVPLAGIVQLMIERLRTQLPAATSEAHGRLGELRREAQQLAIEARELSLGEPATDSEAAPLIEETVEELAGEIDRLLGEAEVGAQEAA